MRIATVATAACVATLAFGASTASAALVNRNVYKCESDATWQVTLDFSGTSYADVTTIDTGENCQRVNAYVEEDGDFSVTNTRVGFGPTHRWNLFGAGITGNSAFAGVATQTDGPGQGTFVIANGSILNATLAGGNASGEHFVAEFHGTGSCGANCYQTRVVEEAVSEPGS